MELCYIAVLSKPPVPEPNPSPRSLLRPRRPSRSLCARAISHARGLVIVTQTGDHVSLGSCPNGNPPRPITTSAMTEARALFGCPVLILQIMQQMTLDYDPEPPGM